jgi:hypothetical protein
MIAPFLKGLDHEIYMTPDYLLPEKLEIPPQHRGLTCNLQNHMRCCYGHRDVMRAMGDEALIMEDDALPNCSNWLEICMEARKLLDEFAIVSVHTRDKLESVWTKRPFMDRNIWIRGGGWGVGSLAYWIRKETAKHWINRPFDGLPMDLGLFHIAKEAQPDTTRRFCAVHPSPLDHVGKTLMDASHA